ncbi:MAG: hypothetical protein O7C74_03405 [Acidobacteria bacterium]|nr:hypothetical protein [Acidobacteriota bacterium]
MEPILSPAHAPVVIVDDEGLYRRALAGGLEKRGHAVICCDDLPAAEATFRRLEDEGRRPSLVVDLIQPGEGNGHLGGLDLLRRLRPAGSRPIIAVMNSDASWLEQAARSLGATRVVRKPDLRRIEPEHLDNALSAFARQVAGEDTACEPAGRVPLPPGENGNSTSPERSQAPLQAEGVLLGALEELCYARDRVAILLLVMRVAADLAARGMLMEVDGDHLKVLGRFGMDVSEDEENIPLDRDNLPARAFWSARLQRATCPPAKALPAGLGDPPQGDAIAFPLLGPDGIIAVIYADSGPQGGPLPELRPLIALAGAARMALAGLRSLRS